MAEKLVLVIEVDISTIPPEKFQSIPLVGDRVVVARDGFLQLSGEVLEAHERPWDDPGSRSEEQAIQEQEMADREAGLQELKIQHHKRCRGAPGVELCKGKCMDFCTACGEKDCRGNCPDPACLDDCTCKEWGMAACWVHGDTPC